MEEELRSHQAEIKAVHDDILAHRSSIEKLEVLAHQFLRDTEVTASPIHAYTCINHHTLKNRASCSQSPAPPTCVALEMKFFMGMLIVQISYERFG